MKFEKKLENLSYLELEKINGGSTCPTYDNADNYAAAEATGSFMWGFICGFFGL